MNSRNWYFGLLVPFVFGFSWGFSQYTEVAQATTVKSQQTINEPREIHDSVKGAIGAKRMPLKNKELRKLVYEEYSKIAESAYHKKHVKRIVRRMQKHQAYVKEASQRYCYDPNFLIALAGVESAGKKEAINESTGAVGLYQLLSLPRSAERDVQRYLGRSWVNWEHPRDNILLGAATLREYTKGKNGDVLLGLVAYNWGPNRRTLKGVKSFEEVKDTIPDSVRLYALEISALFLAIESIERHGEVIPYKKEDTSQLDQIPLPGIDY